MRLEALPGMRAGATHRNAAVAAIGVAIIATVLGVVLAGTGGVGTGDPGAVTGPEGPAGTADSPDGGTVNGSGPGDGSDDGRSTDGIQPMDGEDRGEIQEPNVREREVRGTPVVRLRREGSYTPPLSEGMTISSGLYLVTAQHEGDGPFRVEIVDRTNTTVATAVAATGAWNGETAIPATDGRYRVRVTATGEWAVGIYRLEPNMTVRRPSVSASGSDSRVFGPFVTGGYLFDLNYTQHDYEPVRIAVLGADGQRGPLLMDGSGPVTLTETYNFLPVHYVVVDTNSENWEIEIES